MYMIVIHKFYNVCRPVSFDRVAKPILSGSANNCDFLVTIVGFDHCWPNNHSMTQYKTYVIHYDSDARKKVPKRSLRFYTYVLYWRGLDCIANRGHLFHFFIVIDVCNLFALIFDIMVNYLSFLLFLHPMKGPSYFTLLLCLTRGIDLLCKNLQCL